MSSYSEYRNIFIVIIVLVIIFAIYQSTRNSFNESMCSIKNDIKIINNQNDNLEGFLEKSNCSNGKCEDTSLLEIGNNLLLSPKHYISVNNFNCMVIDLRSLIVASLKEQVDNCRDMNGADGLEKTHMTFNCINDVESVQDVIINRLAAYIINDIKYVYKINMNPHLIISDFKNNLNLLEAVIYPLVYSDLYTINGIRYFTNYMLMNKVVNNLKLSDVLLTTLQRRGIDVLPDTDNHL